MIGATDTWLTIAALAVLTALIRASGPVALGGRELAPRLAGVIALLAPALLAALIVVETVGGDGAIEIDARIAGVAAAGGLLLVRGKAMLTAIVVAATITALLRALG